MPFLVGRTEMCQACRAGRRSRQRPAESAPVAGPYARSRRYLCQRYCLGRSHITRRSHRLHGVHRLRHRLEQIGQRNPCPSPDANAPPQSQHSLKAVGFGCRRIETSSNACSVRAGTAARSCPDVAAITTSSRLSCHHRAETQTASTSSTPIRIRRTLPEQAVAVGLRRCGRQWP